VCDWLTRLVQSLAQAQADESPDAAKLFSRALRQAAEQQVLGYARGGVGAVNHR
jgi:hypothetical protein